MTEETTSRSLRRRGVRVPRLRLLDRGLERPDPVRGGARTSSAMLSLLSLKVCPMTMKRVSGPSGPASTRAMMRSTRLQLGAVEELLEAAYFVVSWRGLEASLRAGLEDFDVSAQGRGWRNAEDVIEAVRPTPVENLGAAVMAVGPQQDLSVGPVGADGAHETAQEGLDFLAAGPFGGPKDGGDEAAFAVEHDDRLKASRRQGQCDPRELVP